MKNWLTKALDLLTASLDLEEPKHELNELDWKCALSSDKKRLIEHLSAFSNQSGGGYLVFGINQLGRPTGISEDEGQKVINQLANLGRDGLEPPITIDHAINRYQNAHHLLFIFVQESSVKPVHLRGKSMEHAFIRSGGTTRLASRQEVGSLMLHSRTPRWEELHASTHMSDSELLRHLNVAPILEMLERPKPTSEEDLLDWMNSEGFVCRNPAGGGNITNLGAISAAKQLTDFPDLSRKAIRMIVYGGPNKAAAHQEREGLRGYAIGFQGLLQYLASMLPQNEVIEKGLRRKQTLYPEIALRELIANALIHQDFSVTGAGPLIEVFHNRIDISNPGGLLPSKQLHRIIGTQPESRNERLARAFRRYKICEERGSGLIKAGLEIELHGLPPIQFQAGSNYFKVSLFSPRPFGGMTQRERLDACYQHAVLKYFSASVMTNTSLRERLKMPEKQRSMVSALIQDAVEAGLIKAADPDNQSRKFAQYVPAWA